MEKIKMNILALSDSIVNSSNFALVLGESLGVRRLPIIIGGFEAQSIAIAIERVKPGRPLTHDLMKSILETYNIRLKSIIISDIIDGIFHAKLVCEENGNITEIDSRASDALALAIRYGCPIYTYEKILESAGITLESDNSPKPRRRTRQKNNPSSSFKDASLEELNRMLQESLASEDYEKAAKIRDEINTRS